jgi:hypothetical protein
MRRSNLTGYAPCGDWQDPNGLLKIVLLKHPIDAEHHILNVFEFIVEGTQVPFDASYQLGQFRVLRQNSVLSAHVCTM